MGEVEGTLKQSQRQGCTVPPPILQRNPFTVLAASPQQRLLHAKQEVREWRGGSETGEDPIDQEGFL